ncbi:hypothetical protein J3E72DRAFT_410149 [Bipolaris maydis]|nr:hypothetical protein J3E72DRAFT_410149 [Bipolaris maydis]KAJ6284803.1 hypothetical protein J3E71DRAFT_375982 [Bipolaris maydis]
MVTTRAAKRRLLVEASRNTAASTLVEPQNTFLKLPQEIRDQIYTFVFDKSVMKFRWKTMTLLCALYPMLRGRTSSLQRTRGLPLWMLTCKQMLHEVIEFIARTHTLSLMEKTERPERAMDAMPNPLVISNNGIRNILLSHPESYLWSPWRTDRRWYCQINNDFLNALKQLHVKNIYLELRWICLTKNSIEASSWIYDERMGFLAAWTPYWEGKFRKVAINVLVYDGIQKGSPNEQFVNEAEKLAVRLVGSGGVVTWHGFDNTRNIRMTWKRVVVERKI